MKADEKMFLIKLKKQQCACAADSPVNVREVVRQIDMNGKRAAYILGKWSDKGWYDYGVSIMAGWLTDKGMNASADA